MCDKTAYRKDCAGNGDNKQLEDEDYAAKVHFAQYQEYASRQGMSMEEVEKEKKGKCPLSNDLKVACEIWHFNALNQPVWFGKLVESLAWCMSKNEVAHSLMACCDWMIIYGEYGETTKGRAGRLFFVDTKDGGDPTISELYEAHWKQERRKNANIKSDGSLIGDCVR